MTHLYDIVYNFLSTYIFAGDNLPAYTFSIGGVSETFGNWLCTLTTIIVLALCLFGAFLFIKWLFKLVAGFIHI